SFSSPIATKKCVSRIKPSGSGVSGCRQKMSRFRKSRRSAAASSSVQFQLSFQLLDIIGFAGDEDLVVDLERRVPVRDDRFLAAKYAEEDDVTGKREAAQDHAVVHVVVHVYFVD